MFNRWLVVVASGLALIVGQGAINVFAASVFIVPVSEDLGIGRGVIASAIGLSSLMTALATPFFGRLVDARGVRATLLLSIPLFALATAALSLLQPSLPLIFALFATSGLCAVAQNPTAYSKVVIAWFDKERGLALGLTLAGVGLGTALIPRLSARLITTFGWRPAYLGLAVTIMVLAFVPVAVFLREPSDIHRVEGGSGALPGTTFSEARRSRQYWMMALAFLIGALTINGTLVHVVSLLRDRGVPLATATAALSASGLALIAGRVVAGYVMDKVFAPYVAIFFLVWPMVGIGILASGLAGPWPVVGTVLLGIGVGAEIDLMSFLVGRYFGLREFGVLHGSIFAVFLIGQAIGASSMGWIFQLTDSYAPGFLAFEVLLAAACMLFASLGPYRYPPARDAA